MGIPLGKALTEGRGCPPYPPRWSYSEAGRRGRETLVLSQDWISAFDNHSCISG